MRCLSWHLKYAVTRWRVEQERHQQRHGQIRGAGGRKGLKHMGNWIWENTGVNKREWRREEWSLRCSWRGRQGLDHWGPNSWEFGLSSDNDQTQKVPERDRIQPMLLRDRSAPLWRKDWWWGVGGRQACKWGSKLGAIAQVQVGDGDTVSWDGEKSLAMTNYQHGDTISLQSLQSLAMDSIPNSDCDVKTVILHLSSWGVCPGTEQLHPASASPALSGRPARLSWCHPYLFFSLQILHFEQDKSLSKLAQGIGM